MPTHGHGLRAFHTKSRNSCLRCKQRRVKCNLQAPVCNNCERRKEHCEWPTLDQASTAAPQQQLDSALTDPALLQLVPLLSAANPAPVMPVPFTYLRLGLRACLANTLSAVPFSGNEVALWSQTLARPVSRFQYLQPVLFSLASLYSERFDPPSLPRDQSLAYQHHLDATTLFRKAPPVVNEENWSAVLMFGMAVLVFQFATQQTCPDPAFNYMETLQVLRMSADLAFEVGPFLFKSKMWAFIQHRVRVSAKPPDPAAQAAVETLEELVKSRAAQEDDQDACLQALNAFKRWRAECEGYPRVWRHYILWPRLVSKEFLLLLSEDDNIALLIFIHWCAVLHMSPNRWWLDAWPRRTAASAMSRLTHSWEEVLAWPKAVFGLPGSLSRVAVLPSTAPWQSTLPIV